MDDPVILTGILIGDLIRTRWDPKSDRIVTGYTYNLRRTQALSTL